VEPRWHRAGSEVEPRWNRNDHALIVAIVHAFQLPMVLSMLQHAWSPKAERSEAKRIQRALQQWSPNLQY
jgi:hypothetical protein